MEQEIRRTVQIKLRQTPEQAEEIEKLFAAFKIGLNFSLKQIEDAYREAMAKYMRVEEVDGVCAGCKKERTLIYSSKRKLFCNSCVMREYSEYTVRGMSISTPQRPVNTDIKTVVDVENLTHVHMMFSQAYGTWKSFNTWRNKREYERKRLENELARIEEDRDTYKLYSAATDIWEHAGDIQKEDKKLTRLRAMALASKKFYGLNPDLPQRDIARLVNKLRELNNLNRPLHFPEYKDEDDKNKKCNPVRSIQLHKNFLKFKDGKLHISLFHKKNNGQVIDFYGNKYLDQFLHDMEEDNNVYTNLIKRVDGKKIDYYLMYPLTVKKNIPTIFDLADVFTISFSPDRVLVHSRCNGDDEKFKIFRLGNMLNAKNHFSEKRTELMEHNTRNSLRRVKKMGNVERRFTRTFNHQLSHSIIEYIVGYLFSIEDGELEKLENVLNQGRIPDVLWTKFRTEGILFSGKETVAKEAPNEWVIESEEKKYIIRKEQTDMLNVYAPRSDNPLIVMWDMTSGITADYGKKLNSVKKMWPVVQQQEFITHKAFLRCVPVKMIQYGKENNLTCSFCHKPFRKKDEFGKNTKETIKSITALLRRVKNLKCESCGKELNMLINQARNLSVLAVEPKKDG